MKKGHLDSYLWPHSCSSKTKTVKETGIERKPELDSVNCHDLLFVCRLWLVRQPHCTLWHSSCVWSNKTGTGDAGSSSSSDSDSSDSDAEQR